MKYTFWNNKGGTGKTSLCFQTICKYAIKYPQKKILCVDLCPQANLSELMLGGLMGGGGQKLSDLWEKESNNRRSIGGYFQTRLSTPFEIPNIKFTDYISTPSQYNNNIPRNVTLIAGDRIIELQANSISALSITQIPGINTYVKIVSWLKDLLENSSEVFDDVFIDTNPSFAIYTQIALTATERLIIPVMADDSSRRALRNVVSLIYGLNLPSTIYNNYAYNSKILEGGLQLPKIHLIIKNRLTQYMGPASAYHSVLTSINKDMQKIMQEHPEIFTFNNIVDGLVDIRDFQTTGVVAFAKAIPFSRLNSGRHDIFGNETQVKESYLVNCKRALNSLVNKIN